MVDYFPAAARLVLQAEGLHANDPVDLGGETKWGISRAAHPEIPDATWQSFTQADALAIYRAQYWDAARCGDMPWPWALAIFDGQVNQGSVIKLAQSTLGIRQDGLVGPATLSAMQKAPPELLNLFFAGRAIAYIASPQFPTYSRGWFKRLFAMRVAADSTPTVVAPATT